MSTYTQILYQVIFGSKDYTNFLTKVNQDKLYNYIAGILWNKKCKPHIVGGYSNHIHIVCDLHPTNALSYIVKDIKKASHEMMVREKSIFQRFPGWQVGFGAFTYSQSGKDQLIQYVKNQENHHKKLSFKEELIALFKEHGIDFDEKYLIT